jgi:thiol-disulfide isomerase/thioredoxin
MRKKAKWIVVISAALLCCLVAFGIVLRRRAPTFSNTAQPGVVATSLEDLDKSLPEARLVNRAGLKLEDNLLRQGKVVLVFVTPTCKPCLSEGEFLRTIDDRGDGDIRFYGIVSFGDEKISLKVAEEVFPFEVFYDQESLLARGLNINRVPIKIFLEDGIIRDVWDGSSKTEEAKAEFRDWFKRSQ